MSGIIEYDIEYFDQQRIDELKQEGKLSKEQINALQSMVDRQNTFLKKKGFYSMKNYLDHWSRHGNSFN